MKNSFVIFVALLLAAACSPFRIYVSPSGDDAADGGRQTPLQTAPAALSKAAAFASGHAGRDIEIVFADGVYPVTETMTVDGSAFTSPLTLRAAEGAHPVFSAEKPVGGWEKLTDARALEKVAEPDKVLQADLKASGVTSFGNPIGDDDRFDLYFNGKRQTLAMWPNEGFAYAGKALGPTPRASYLGNTFEEPELEYVDAHIDGWTDEPDPCLHGYWCFDWFDMYNPVEIDKTAKKLTVGGAPSTYGYRTGCRFRGVNLLSELDMPGEYWVDRERGLIFWYAPDSFNGEGTTVSDFAGDYIFVLDDARDVSFIGLGMCGSRGGALSVNGGENLLVEDCIFQRFAKDVITVDGGVGHSFRHCSISELGCAAIILQGGDRTTLSPSGFEVSDCTIETLSLYRKTYQPCIRFGGCGLTVSHNLFHDCPSSALRLDGNDILVEYNRFEDLVLESDDQGGIDIFNNYNFRGIVIRHNYFHNIGDPKDNIAGGVRFDDRISGMLVESNVFDHCGSSGFGGVQVHGGEDNMIGGNVFYDCTYALSHSPWDPERFVTLCGSDCAVLGLTPAMDSLTPMGKLYLERYPDIAHVFDRDLVNRNYLIGNLVVRTPELIARGRNIVSEDNVFLPDDREHSLEHWVSDEVLAGYGMAPVEFDRMGPEK